MRRPYSIEDAALSDADLGRLRQAATSSVRLGPSQLVGTFGQTRGFGLVFAEGDRPAAETLAPDLVPFLRLVQSRKPMRRSLWRRQDAPTAFYVNALVLEGGAEVGAHVDGTLGPALGAEGRTPAFVSVLYLEVPPPPSGELVLLRGPLVVGTIAPKVGRLVTFDGTLGHAVRAHSASDDEGDAVDEENRRRRVSLVCEHYVATEEEQRRLGAPRLHSRSQGPLFPQREAPSNFGTLVRRR